MTYTNLSQLATTLASCCLFAATADAQPRAEATRCDQPPDIDGSIDDDCWRVATWNDQFAQRDPVEGATPSEHTRFAVAFDDRAVYVAVEARQSVPIIGYLSRRDSTSPSDWITVAIGAAGDRRRGASFSVNPAGVRIDRLHFEDTGSTQTWDAVWEVETTVADDVWIAEYRIPLSQLRFEARSQEWDVQVERTIAEKHEVVQWSLVSKEDAGVVSRWGRLTGVGSVDAPVRLEALPYLLGGLQLRRPQGGAFADPRAILDAGGDLTYSPSGDVTMELTLNPDFGQVEADPAEINLSAFETRFSERRPFFVENNSAFALNGPEFFYSRRIGRPPQVSPTVGAGELEPPPDQTTVLAAATLRAKAGPTSVALLDAVTPQINTVLREADESRNVPVEPATNFLVGRIQREIGDGQSTVGMLFTSVNRDVHTSPESAAQLRSQAYSGAVDADIRWAENAWRLSALAGFSSVFGTPDAIVGTQHSSARYFQRPDAEHVDVDPERTSLDGWTGKLQLARETGSLVGSVGATANSPGFEINDAGFLSSTDRVATWADAAVRDLDPGRYLRSWSVGPRLDVDWTFGGERTGLELDLVSNVQWLNYWTTSLSGSYSFPEWCVNCTRGGPAVRRPYGSSASVGLATDGRKPLIGSLSAFVFAQPDSATVGSRFSVGATYRPTRALELGLEPSHSWFDDGWMWVDAADERFVFANLVTNTTRVTARANVTLTPDISLEIWAQPLIGAGAFADYMKLAENRSPDFDRVFSDVATVDRESGSVSLDEDGDGLADFDVPDGDFLIGSHRNTVVFRWEWRPGSTFFAVWQHRRDHFLGDGRFRPLAALGTLYGPEASQEHVVMLKLTHWLGWGS